MMTNKKKAPQAGGAKQRGNLRVSALAEGSLSKTARLVKLIGELCALRRWIVHRGKKPWNVTIDRPLVGWQKPRAWMGFEEVFSLVDQGLADGVGFVFADNDTGFVGLDLDDCVSWEGDHATVNTCAAKLMELFPHAYWEYSPSRKGLHCIMKADPSAWAGVSKLKVSNFEDCANVEIFANAGYLTFTGDTWQDDVSFEGYTEELAELIRALKAHRRRGQVKNIPASNNGHGAPESAVEDALTLEDVRACLDAIPADDYDIWIKVGAALKTEMGDAGFDLWDEWSAKSPNYGGTGKKWPRLPTGATYGSLIALAREFQPGFLTPSARARKARANGNRRQDAARKGHHLIKDNRERATEVEPPLWLGHPGAQDVQALPPEQTIWERWAAGALGLAQALEDRESPPWVVDQIVRAGSLNIIYGAPGSMKSMLLADMALCVAAGRPWLAGKRLEDWMKADDTPGIPTLVRPVIWLDLDNGRLTTLDRFGALARGHGVAPDAPLHILTMPQPWPTLDNDDNARALELLTVAYDAGLIVIDNLGLIAGEIEENNARMASVMGRLRNLAEKTGAAVVVIHHQRKAGVLGPGVRRGESLRGHSSIEASLDSAFLVEREEGGDKVRVIPTKIRNGPWPKPLDAIFTYTHKPDGNDLHEARFFQTEPDKVDTETRLILEILRHADEAKGKTRLVAMVQVAWGDDATRPGEKTIRAHIEKLVAKGLLEEEPPPPGKGARAGKRYRLTSEGQHFLELNGGENG